MDNGVVGHPVLFEAPNAAAPQDGRPAWFERIPVASWLRSYRRDSLRADVVGGLTVAAVVLPNVMAYAAIAGLPVAVGLYTALAAMLVYPLLGTSRPLSVTTTSAIAMLTATVVAAKSASEGPSPAAVAATLALLVGGTLVLARILRLGFLANFISTPVLVGFQAGVGVVILVGQLGGLLGVAVQAKTPIGTLVELPGLVRHAHPETVLVGLAGFALLLVLPRLLPRAPAALVWVAVSIAASAALGLGVRGVAVVGAVPSGLPHVSVPDLALARDLWPSALGIALMSFTESVAVARTYWKRGDPPIRANAELVAVGAANVAVAFAGGMPSGGGASQTTLAEQAGVKSQLGQWVGAAAVVVILLFLARAIGVLPKAALAALVVLAAVSMIKLEGFRAIAVVRRDELAWALATVIGVVLVGTLQGILIAVVISFLTLVHQADHPPVYALAYATEENLFRRVGEDAGDETFPGLLMLRTEGRLTFANAANFKEKTHALVEASDPKVIVLECSGIPDIEYTALVKLTEAEENLRARGVDLWLAAVNPGLLRILERCPLGHTLGRERRFGDLHKALGAWRGAGESTHIVKAEAGGADASRASPPAISPATAPPGAHA